MSRLVVDASVAIKWYVPEVHSAAAARLLEGGNELLAPDLIFPEFGNILWKKRRMREIRETEARDILKALRTVPLEVYPSEPLLDAAFEIAISLDRSVYDSLYVALAESQDCRFVTADGKLHNALQNTPLAKSIAWVAEW
ncbi:MAG: twitching motility protein PilT [Candidatus Muproteobacteria bacterium RBG_16_65_34]|uniref:Ribonuclease VapC n=1 Tax=Candidatus Muproteobacteria bacterium RBG_16_65_34 TaxID=1817760 RepID=A0A1F6TVX5_9PROT|nr:MAG: twitching motility protein PilT [Candidatus Muproteobacteria bacterium RBG_16_65_34]